MTDSRQPSARSKLVVVSALALGVGLGLAARGPLSAPSGDPRVVPTARAAPRDLLNRVWFDRLPERRTDDVTIGIFLGGGVGLFDTGSAYRASFELFEFERRSADLDLVFLHDKKRGTVTYKVSACDEKPPFDLCLTLEGAPRGPKRLYGFSDDDDEAAKVPWSRDLRESARARARVR
jgi:hypothetical protein